MRKTIKELSAVEVMASVVYRDCGGAHLGRSTRSGEARGLDRRTRVVAKSAAVFLIAALAVFGPAVAGVTEAAEAGEDTASMAPIARSGKLINGIVATVDGEALTLRDLRVFRSEQAPFIPVESRGDFQSALQGLVEARLLKAEYEKHGISSGDAEVRVYIERVMQQTQSSRAQVEAALAEAGLSYDEYFERMRGEVNRLTLVDLLIRSRVNVSDEEIERIWETDPRFVGPEKLEIAHIYLAFPPSATDADKQAVLARAQELGDGLSGLRFSGAAKKHSMGPTADDGGYLGKFTRAEMAPHFREALDGLDEGDISAPVADSSGVHIVRLLEIHEAGREPLESVAEGLRAELYERRMQERFQRWANEDLRNAHHITIHLEDLAVYAAS